MPIQTLKTELNYPIDKKEFLSDKFKKYTILKNNFSNKDLLVEIKNVSRENIFNCINNGLIIIATQKEKEIFNLIADAFIATIHGNENIIFFSKKIKKMNLFFVQDEEYAMIEIQAIFSKMKFKLKNTPMYFELLLGEDIQFISSSKTGEELFVKLRKSTRIRDNSINLKHIKTDSWNMDVIVLIKGIIGKNIGAKLEELKKKLI